MKIVMNIIRRSAPHPVSYQQFSSFNPQNLQCVRIRCYSQVNEVFWKQFREQNTGFSRLDTQEWNNFIKETEDREDPANTLLYVLYNYRLPSGTAIDLGCGTGSDTLFLLKRNWKVIAIDNNPLALSILQKRVKKECPELEKNLTLIDGCMEDYPFTEKVQVINATQSLPFCHPAQFQQVWERIVNALEPEGVFVGQFYHKTLTSPLCVPSMNIKAQQVNQLMRQNFHDIILVEEPDFGRIEISTAGRRNAVIHL